MQRVYVNYVFFSGTLYITMKIMHRNRILLIALIKVHNGATRKKRDALPWEDALK